MPHAVMDAIPGPTMIAPTHFPDNVAPQLGTSAPQAGSFPTAFFAAPNPGYAGSITENFSQLDLGAADDMFAQYLTPEALRDGFE